MNWSSVDSQSELDNLNRQICWEDSRTVEYYAKYANEAYFPVEINRSGHLNKNIHLLCEICSSTAPYLEVVLIDCDWFYYSILDHLHLLGHVSRLKHVDVQDGKGSTVLRCSRVIYRFLQTQDLPRGLYFRNADSITT